MDGSGADPEQPGAALIGAAPDGVNEGDPTGRRRRALRALAGFALGVLLVGAALRAVAGSEHDLLTALRSAMRSSPWLLALAVLLPALNWLAVSLSFWAMMGRFGRVGVQEMAALVGVAWLLNYLPLRPGLIGRIGYHKAVHGISIRDSAFVTVLGMATTALSVAWLLLTSAALGGRGGWAWPVAIVSPLLALSVVSLALRARAPGAWRLPAMAGLRYLDLLIWVARYTVVFVLVGVQLDLPAAVAVAAVSQAALAVPVVGNGLGLREWAVGLTAGLLPAGLFAAGSPTEMGLAADLLNRAAELAAAVPVGLACWWSVAARIRSNQRR